MAKKEEIREILRKVDAGGDTEGQTLPTRAGYAADDYEDEDEDSSRLSFSSHNTIGRVLDALSLPPSEDFLEKSITETVLEKRTSILNSYQGSLGSIQKPLSSQRQSGAGKQWGESSPLQEWLERRNLGEVYHLLASGGFDDVEEMLGQMRSPMPIENASLVQLGIRKPGHRKRLLMRLEEAAGLFQPPPRPRLSYPHSSPSLLPCCSVQNNASTFGVSFAQPLKEWLHGMKLEYVFERFQQAGYEDLEAMVQMMAWTHPITDEVLATEVGISKPGHRSRILSRLQEEALGVSRGAAGTIFEPGEKATACEMCRTM